MALCFTVGSILYDHKFEDPKNILLTDLMIPSFCVYLESNGWQGQWKVLRLLRGKRQPRSQVHVGEELVP